jgi:hypothetical protein
MKAIDKVNRENKIVISVMLAVVAAISCFCAAVAMTPTNGSAVILLFVGGVTTGLLLSVFQSIFSLRG